MNTIFESKGMRIVGGVIGVMLALFLFAQTVQTLKAIRFVGATPINNTLSVSGSADVMVTPDLARVSFSISHDAKTVIEANEAVKTQTEKVLAAIKALSIDAKDIQTADYSVYPRYDYVQQVCTNAMMPCTPGKNVLIGYTVSTAVNLKIRNLDTVGTVLNALAQNGVTNVSGLTFGNDDEDKAQNEARGKAIKEAQDKAQVLADQLGVTIVGITDFSENTGGYYPYAAKVMNMSMDSRESAGAPVPTEVGQNTITSNVTITYQIQ